MLGYHGLSSPVQKPTPVRHVLQGNPGRAAERPGQMRERRVARDDEVKMGHDGRAVEERLRSCIEVVPENLDHKVFGPL